MTMRSYQSGVAERGAVLHVKSVLLIDNYPVVALGLELAFRGCPGLSLVKKISNPAAAIQAIAECSPDAVVLDPVFDGTLHFSLIQKVRAAVPSATIVVFSSLPAEPYGHTSVAAGADFFLSKDHDCRDLVGILIGSFLMSSSSSIRPVTKTATIQRAANSLSANYEARLTPREQEIAALLSRGLSVAEIALRVGTSRKTVSVHRDNLRIKLGCRDSTELVARLAWIHASATLIGANIPPGSSATRLTTDEPVSV